MTEQDRPPQTFDKLSREQLEIYAKELAAHVQTERGLRKELERHNRQLEQRVREITALNRLFQKHLDERQAVVTAYREVLVGLKELVKGAGGLEQWARSQPLPDLQDLPKLAPDDEPRQ